MSLQSLEQFTVLITRPEHQQSEFKSMLKQHGARLVSKPLISIEGLNLSTAIQTTKSKILDLDNYHFLLFVSTNAAEFGAEWIDNYWPQFPSGIQVIALGPATANRVESLLGCRVSIPQTGITSEDVLEMPQLLQVESKRVAIFRGNGGRELLAETLRNRGASVDYIEVYSRKVKHYNANSFALELKQNSVNVISANSVETIESLILNLGDNVKEFLSTPLLVPSSRVAAKAKALGFSKTINANGADSSSLIGALQHLADIMV